jgi:broad specificity phosphatase PhoE
LYVIYLVRHGETVWNVAGRQQGHLDSPLTERGVAQARAAGRALRQVLPDLRDVIVETSPLGRARQTATLLCAELDISPDNIVVSPLLIEHDFGTWQGLTFAQIDQRYPDARQQREAEKWDYRVEGGESYALLSVRARRWLGTRAATATVAITHEMISRTIQGAYAALSPQETLGRSHRQDRIYRLCDDEMTELATE